MSQNSTVSFTDGPSLLQNGHGQHFNVVKFGYISENNSDADCGPLHHWQKCEVVINKSVALSSRDTKGGWLKS